MARHHRGFSLIELMISMSIGIIMLGALTAVYIENKRVLNNVEGIARVQENARIAIEFMSHDAQLAGFYGKTSFAGLIQGSLSSADPLPATGSDCGTQWYTDLEQSLWVVNNANPFAASCIPAANYQTGTDMLVVRHAKALRQGATRQSPDSSSPITLPIPSEISTGTVFLRTSSSAGTLWRAGMDPPPASPSGSIEDRELVTRIYYIRPWMVAASETPQVPTLVYEELGRFGGEPAMRATALVPGVEQMQIQLGLDTDGDGAVDLYRASESTARASAINPEQILAIRIWLLLREDDSRGFEPRRSYTMGDTLFTPPDDGLERFLVTRTIAVRNALPGVLQSSP
ncbi:MAG: PilW family protein [Gammaproteobacteria bacterium]|nr:PilW family protein [Gammaproteobacteria bacterium]